MSLEIRCKSKKEIIEIVNIVLENFCKGNIQKETLEWYLKNQLNTYLLAINIADTWVELDKANKILRGFLIDSMDWNTDIFKRCSEVTSCCDGYIKILKNK